MRTCKECGSSFAFSDEADFDNREMICYACYKAKVDNAKAQIERLNGMATHISKLEYLLEVMSKTYKL